MKESNLCIHIVHETRGLLGKVYTCFAPHVGEEIRFGGKGNEKYYRVDQVVWVYDEPENSCYRVNIGVLEIEQEGR